MWRTSTLNFSIRKVSQEKSGTLRHLGWESPETEAFSTEVDINNIPWEEFIPTQQDEEIKRTWPNISTIPNPSFLPFLFGATTLFLTASHSILKDASCTATE